MAGDERVLVPGLPLRLREVPDDTVPNPDAREVALLLAVFLLADSGASAAEDRFEVRAHSGATFGTKTASA